MKKGYFDYPFPNGVFAFWVLSVPPIMFVTIMLSKVIGDAIRGTVDAENLSMLYQLLIVCLITLTLATIIASSFPAIKLSSKGVEVRFYSLFYTRWILLPWNSISRVTQYSLPPVFLFKDKQKDLIVYSNSLPIIYHIPSILWGHSFERSFIIGNEIRGYNEILKVLEAEIGNMRQVAQIEGSK